MAEKDIDPAGALKVKTAEQYITFRGETNAVGASESIEDFFGSALNTKVGSVVINNVGATDLNVNVDGTDATATTITLVAGQSQRFDGRKKHLDKMRIFADSSLQVSISELISE